jgi:hypothetical protein
MITKLSRSTHGFNSGPDHYWQHRAACAGRYDLFDAETRAMQQRAAHLCRRHCPVLAECTAMATSGPRWYGVLAGMVAGWRTPPDPGHGTWCE